MLDFLRNASDRKLRLVLCACCRQLWFLFQDNQKAQVIEVAESYAGGQTSAKELRYIRRFVLDMLQERMGWREEDAQFMMDTFEGIPFADGPTDSIAATFAAARVVAETVNTRQLRQTLTILADTQPESRKRKARQECKRNQCSSIREIIGPLPFHPITIAPAWLAWNAGTLGRLAQGIYDERAFDRLPVLADALEDAGCTNADILDHCRQPRLHVRGCWVVDLLTGRS
jgi:hypothetical protein